MRIRLSLLFLAALLIPSAALAQGVELSRADRLAILYTPQLTFAAGGEPLIKIGITDAEQNIAFRANTEVSVLPLGEGGPEITMPANTELTVSISDGSPGTYRYHVIVAELTPTDRDMRNSVRAEWEARGYTVETHEVGAVFAVAGQRFDTRRTLVTIGSTDDRRAARDLEDEVERRFGVEADVHSELDAYPGGTLTMEGGGITITHRDLLMIHGDETTVFTVRDVEFDRGTRYEGSEDRQYVGALIFTADSEGDLALVNEVSAERLLEGIVPAEIYADAPMDALRAQAVAARSELLTDLGGRHLADPYMTCSDQRCQVYRGVGYENERTSLAVRDTWGQVLADGDQIINAYFSANNGGFAASNGYTWGGEQREYLQAHFDGPHPRPEWEDGLSDDEVRAFLAERPDAYADIDSFGSGRYFRWREEMTGDALTEAVNQRYDVGQVLDLEIVERGPSGRVSRMNIIGAEGEVVVERELNVRRAFGGLRSALLVFDIERTPDGAIAAITFDGGGFGHGVGMCQSGAIGAAERGMDYVAILANYYPGTDLRELY